MNQYHSFQLRNVQSWLDFNHFAGHYGCTLGLQVPGTQCCRPCRRQRGGCHLFCQPQGAGPQGLCGLCVTRAGAEVSYSTEMIRPWVKSQSQSPLNSVLKWVVHSPTLKWKLIGFDPQPELSDTPKDIVRESTPAPGPADSSVKPAKASATSARHQLVRSLQVKVDVTIP